MAIKRKTIDLSVNGNTLTPADAATGQPTTDAGVQGENEAVWLHADVPADWQDLTVRLRVTALDGTFDESGAAVGGAADMPLRQGVLVPGRLAVVLVGLAPDGDTGNYLVRKSADCRTLTVQASAQPGNPAAQVYPQAFESLKDEVQGECVHTVVGAGAAQITRLDGQTVRVGFTGGGGGDMLAANYANGSGGANVNTVDHAVKADSADHAAAADNATDASHAANADHAVTAGTAANAAVADNTKIRPRAHVYQSTAVSVPNAAQTYLTFDTVRYDTDGMYSAAAPGRLTVKHAGVYLIGGYVCYNGDNSTGARGAAIRLNGAARITNTSVNVPAVPDTHLCLSTVWHMAAGDYVELGTYQASGSAKSSSAYTLSGQTVCNEFYAECLQPD